MNHPEVVLLVRFKTSLSPEEIARVAEERTPEFKALKGLQQKYYIRDVASGEYAGLYLWKSTGSHGRVPRFQAKGQHCGCIPSAR